MMCISPISSCPPPSILNKSEPCRRLCSRNQAGSSTKQASRCQQTRSQAQSSSSHTPTQPISLPAPDLFREVCVLVSRINRNLAYKEHDQALVTKWVESVYDLSCFVLGNGSVDNETLASLSYLLDFWSTISCKAHSCLGLKEVDRKISAIYTSYIQFYAQAMQGNEDLRSGHEMLVVYKEPLSSLARISLPEVENWLCLAVGKIHASPSEESLWTLILLVYAAKELFKCNPKGGLQSYLRADSMEDLCTLEYTQYINACSNTAVVILATFQATKALSYPIPLIYSFISYSTKLIDKFCKGTQTVIFDKIAQKLSLKCSNEVLDCTVKTLVDIMVAHSNVPQLFDKAARGIRSVVDKTVYRENKYMCGDLLLAEGTVDSLLQLHYDCSGAVFKAISVLPKSLYYAVAKLFFIVLFVI
eukprot:TRINITY_DN11748_c0_g1_i4.p1 TRINITY_DN11748_c0_g1~~TRINITY_DN11748_c0_g1_i4.p1  ORF type:complete len:417 (-),score=64.50 TRINITY_DN11748_c0_g1_i4:678-1928(-)